VARYNFRSRILALIERAGRKGISNPQLAKILRPPRYTRISPRTAELRHQGKVGIRGTQKNPASGEPNGLWVATKFLSPAEKLYERKLRELWELRRALNRRMGRLSVEQKILALKDFQRVLERVGKR
jgi:hypothetical protein